MKRFVSIALFSLAATLGALSYTYAHLDYRDRIEYLTHVASDQRWSQRPTRDNLHFAIALGIPAVTMAAIAIGVAVFELGVFRRIES